MANRFKNGKGNRSHNRVLRISREQIEHRMEKLKKRMNKLYVEYMACEEAIKLFVSLTPEEVQTAKDKETLLREQIVSEIAKAETVPETAIQAVEQKTEEVQ